ncbi:hypothetical protein DPMN_188404 [Dreissena polymorpha]|uniref:Uncharacterized protein n=1 Tax=Dreissena polymorpha TaxID=45954 RepID=A0A9D4DSW2_DREPO|nr:hypothetical protein DPMN_188404 [Dreissena polymorpha]
MSQVQPTAKSSCYFKAGSRFVECQHMCQEYTIPAPAPVTSVSSTSAERQFLHPTVKEGGVDMQIQELWQCQHWTITPRCIQVG